MLDRLAELAAHPAPTLEADFPRGDSAVLVLLVGAATKEPAIILTRRATRLRTDPGFVAFPGGRIEDGETPEEAAVRECVEKVAIVVEGTTIHGRLPESWNGAGFRIIPVVASLPGDVELLPEGGEVHEAAELHLAEVMRDDLHRNVTTTIDGHDFVDDSITLDLAGTEWELFGPTADIARDPTAFLRGQERDSIRRRQADLDHFAAHRWV
ncbi:MAG: CoA pyrophosphatase [Acidimicrobiales bacterium]|nr:CoA pyrophosphatase [Acidimicrobiales bacterium]